MFYKHGFKQHELYNTWITIRRRTCNPKSKLYKNYGARGINLFEDWIETPKLFIEYIESNLGPRPKGCEIDRVNNNKGYIPGNLRWANRQIQNSNTRRATYVIWRGANVTLFDAMQSVDCPFNLQTVKARLKRGWSVADAMTKPLGNYPVDRYATKA